MAEYSTRTYKRALVFTEVLYCMDTPTSTYFVQGVYMYIYRALRTATSRAFYSNYVLVRGGTTCVVQLASA